jgi:Cu-processing system permease protein
LTNILAIAGKEIREGIRNRWILATTLLLAALALTLTFLGSAPTGSLGASPLAVTIASLSSLTIMLLPLIALLLAYDAICGELDRGTLLLLLSYPVARWQIVAGKYLGHLMILAFATCIGYGLSAAALMAISGSTADWQPFLAMIGSSVLLGSAFLALGYLVSAWVADRGLAGGLAIGIWLLFVLIYDMALLGLLVVDQGNVITAPVLNMLLLFNPADAYRVLNLTSFAGVSQFTGMAGVTQDAAIHPVALILALLVWTAVPLGAAAMMLRRRQI